MLQCIEPFLISLFIFKLSAPTIAVHGSQALKAQHGERLLIQQMDVTQPESITACAAAVVQQVPYLSLLFNVSGLLHIPGVCLHPSQTLRVYLIQKVWFGYIPRGTNASVSHCVPLCWNPSLLYFSLRASFSF